MFSIFSKKPAVTARVNQVPITVLPKETLLQAALRQGIDFPHSCRVGGCATCKCRLVEGTVKQLTKSAYVLSDDELDQGFILACQAVPQTDIAVELAPSHPERRRQVSGRVVGQQRLTRDITLLRLQLDECLPYKAGQFAHIGLASLGELRRSYSFATPAQLDARVEFFIRKVPGGALSTLVNERDVVGEMATVDGPLGDFWLRPADAPLLFIAGGSGLAPILAVMQEALRTDVRRPATLLFGARQEQDLYALDAVAELAARWPAAFTFVPVLSEAPADSAWKGARGMVADRIQQSMIPGSHAYLCGPPPMIDSCIAVLERGGVARGDIYADRFTTLYEAQVQAQVQAQQA